MGEEKGGNPGGAVVYQPNDVELGDKEGFLRRTEEMREAHGSMLRGNFEPRVEVVAEVEKADGGGEYRKRALESISGSMVWVEKRVLVYDPVKK